MIWPHIGAGCLEAAKQAIQNVKEIKILKGGTNLQTNADMASQQAIIEYLKSEGVSCVVYSEDLAEPIKVNGGSEKNCIILDALDNTNFFVRGDMSFCSIGIMMIIDGDSKYAFVSDLSMGDIYYCDNLHAYHNGKIMKVKEDVLGRKVIVGWAPYKERMELFTKQLDPLTKKDYSLYNFGGQLAAVRIIKGYYDANVKIVPEPLQELCATMILEKAGGYVTTLEGKPVEYKPGIMQTVVGARTKEIHEEVLSMFRL